MKEILWIEKYRQQIFVLEILVAIIFGPAIANILDGSGWMTLGMTLGVFFLLEVSLTLTRLAFAKAAHSRTKKVHDKSIAAHNNIKKEYQELSGERLTKAPAPSRKKKPRKKKGKKTHRR